MIISRFVLKNTSGMTSVPKIEIVDREILYQSPIFRTPLRSSTEINTDKVEEIIWSQYEAANVSPLDVQTGAVIITGETATKSNAQEVLHQLSNKAGDFLVATAGPDLEAIIAAKGSGVYNASKNSRKVFANIDIGGGTTNIAVYQHGKLLGTCALHIGGKLIEFENELISYISDKVKPTISQLGLSLKEGSVFSPKDIKQLTHSLASVIARTLNNSLINEDECLFVDQPPNWKKQIDVITFSGGVAECMYQMDRTSINDNQYEDIGKVLGESLKENKVLSNWEWRTPHDALRATVLGAGTQTTSISGATIQVNSTKLPIKNLPVHQIDWNNSISETIPTIINAIKEGIDLYDPLREGQNFALYLANFPLLNFREIHDLSDAILNRYIDDVTKPLVIVLEKDLARALGQSILTKKPNQECICIDQIKVEHGDYLDVGKKLQSGVVPVVVKTLAF